MRLCTCPIIGAVLSTLLVGVGVVKAQSSYFAPVVYGNSTEVYSQDEVIPSPGPVDGPVYDGPGYHGPGYDGGCGCGAPLGSDCGCDVGGCGIDCSCCDDCWLGYRGCGCGGLNFEVEALLIAYHRADGMRVGTQDSEWVNSSFNLAPRITLGWASCEGTGVRIRWFDYNHNERTVANVAGEFISTDTFNLDFELFDEITLNRNWTLELSGGYRYNNFAEVMNDFVGPDPEVRANWSVTQGGIFGIEARRDFCWGALYGGFKGSILFGDKNRLNTQGTATTTFERLGDVVHAIWEIGLGYENSWTLCNGALAYVRLGGEWQQWENFSSNFNNTGALATDEDTWRGHSDVGFGGFTFSVGYIQ